jgi:hypothetical protein
MAKRIKKSRSGISLTEFKAWLQGIEEMQPADWAPNAEQWTKIKQKISSIEDEVDVEVENKPAPPTAWGGASTGFVPPISRPPIQQQFIPNTPPPPSDNNSSEYISPLT